MTWAFDVTSNIPRITQSGTDANIDGILTAINGMGTVARSTAYTTSQMIKPPTPTGFWYRCSTAGTTAATAPTYGTTLGGTTTDGTAVFTAFRAPDARWQGTGYLYYMPDVRFNITGTVTNSNPQVTSFVCWDLLLSAAGSNFTSGTWASDGVTPLYDGIHFTATRESINASDNSSGGLQLQLGAFTFIGGEVQVSGAIGLAAGTTPRTYYTRWRSAKQWSGVTTTRIRAYATAAIFRQCEFYSIAYDLFQMPAEFSVKARKSEYVAQYVGSYANGVNAYFKASALENVDGSYDFDNYSGGYVELFNCAKGASLNVTTQLPSSNMCTPLYQDVIITAKNTAGEAVQDVRFTATDAPTNSPTVTITTIGGLKTWDFRNALSYQATTNVSGIANTSPILKVWYYQAGLKQNLRFPASTVTYEGRAYNYKTGSVSVVLGSNTAQSVSAGMIGLDTATTITETAALALTGITLTPSGATGGSIVVSSSHTLQDIWNYYRAWISQFANRSSNDTWTCLAGQLSVGAWNITVNSGVTLSGDSTISSVKTTGTITNSGTITVVYQDTSGTSTTWQFQSVQVGTSLVIFDASGTTKYFQGEVTSAGTYNYYIPPGTAGTYYYAIEKYGTKREAGSFLANSGGVLFYVPSYAEDVGISETTKATVAAYTAIETLDKLYDRVAYFRLSEVGIKLGQIAERNGTAVALGNFSLLVNQSASAVLTATSSLVTIKSTSLANGTKFTLITATPPKTVTANTTEVITASIEDAAGNSSVTIQGGSGDFTLWKITNATSEDDYATGTNLGNVGNTTFRFLDAPGYKIVIRDNTTSFRQVCPMDKGIYTKGLFFGDQVQLAQSAEVTEINTKVDIMQLDVTKIIKKENIIIGLTA